MDRRKRDCLSSSSRRKVLEELVENGRSTSYEIAKKMGISDSTVSRHLEILSESGLVNPPEIDTSGGRLKKIYKATDEADKTIKDFWDEEIRSAPKIVRKKYLPRNEEEKNKR